MVADIADEDAARTGLRREGLFFGILNFGEKCAAGLAVLIGGALVDYFARLVPGEAVQSDATISRIGWIFGGVPAMLLFAAVIVVAGYRLDHQAIAAIQLRLRERAVDAPLPP